MAEQAENYVLKSNRESGFGRYDVMMIPKKENLPAIIMEFKVRRAKEKDLNETVQMALQQIEEKNYDAELLSLGIAKERIRHYGFAFDMQIKDIIQKNEAYKGNNLNIPKELKANAFIAPGVCIACAGHSIDHEQRAKGISTSKPVTIEKDVWTMW